ncbi:MAG: tetratricopeptide repeat protein [candidate division KSB1 bacterium]|nr:tetratricopeptide repeat protein [candidate division KSB1 bacterium]MDZ7368824.1 tetratricopeptide repeat protein [candidate division KSB1 bacterium]MDZ7406668.1 tetratricopeptide repeat protein [candidate division KSB1 bacterium]
MLKSKNFVSGLARCLILCGVLAATSGFAQKKLTLTTNSPQAKEHFMQAIKSQESFGQDVPQLARKAVAADSNFAMAHMLVAATTPAAQRQKHIDKFLALSPTASKGEQLYLQGMAHYYKNEDDKALEIFKQLNQMLPEDRMVYMMLGQIERRKGNFTAAIAAFEAANKIDASLPRASTFIGDCYLLQDKYDKARMYYKQVVAKVDPDATPFGPFFGQIWADLYEGKPDNALKTLDEYMDRYNRNGAAQGFPPVWIWNHKARINLEFGRTAEALRCYEIGYKSVPPSQIDSTQKLVWLGRMHHGRARTLAKMGKHDEAWQIAEQVKKMIDDGGEQGKQYVPAYHYLAGYIKLEKGDYAAAIEHLKQTDLNDPFHKLLLARATLKAGDKTQALKLCEEIIKYTTNNIERALSYNEAKKIIAANASN